MPALTIRNIPERTLARLRDRAERAHRSLNGEVLSIFEDVTEAVPDGPVFMPPIPLPAKPVFKSYREDVMEMAESARERKKKFDKFLSLAGSWDDDRSAAEIIADIESSRTPGREVEL